MKVWRFKRGLAAIVCDEGRVNGSGVRARERGESTTYYLVENQPRTCLLYTSPSPRDRQKSRMPSSA